MGMRVLHFLMNAACSDILHSSHPLCIVPASDVHLGWVVRKPVNANPGLRVDQSITFSCIKMFFTSYFLSSLRLFKFKREG